MNKQEAKWNYTCDEPGCKNKNRMTKRGLALHKKHKHPLLEVGGVAKGIAAMPVMDRAIEIKSYVRPVHYRVGIYEVKDVLNVFFPTDPLAWNAGKYLLRMGRKSSIVEDARKAIQYLQWVILREEENEKKALNGGGSSGEVSE